MVADVVDEEPALPRARRGRSEGVRSVILAGDAAALDRLADRPRLRFPEPLEAAFRDDYFDRWLSINRRGLVLGLILFCGFSVVDPWATPDALRTVLWLRFGLGGAAILLLLLLSHFRWYRTLMQPMTAVGVFACGLAIIFMELAMTPADPGYELYVFGMGLVAVFGYTTPRLRFWYATITGWTLAVLTLAVGFDHHVPGDVHHIVHFAVIEALLVGANVVGMIAVYFFEIGDRRGFVQALLLDREREESDALLRNVLPEPIVDRLKRGDQVADRYDDVGVLIADVVDFTPLSAKLDPVDLVAFLDDLFARFDRIAEREGLEKIKTVGDAYIAVSGLPEPCPDGADRLADAALAMCAESRSCERDRGLPVQLRIGLHIGPVVAGVIGLRRFTYDLWGDTVNTASRMQTYGPPGTIHVSSAIRDRLRDRYAFVGPTSIDVKGKGQMSTYLLTGRCTGRGN